MSQKEIQVSLRIPAEWAHVADEIALNANRDGLSVPGAKNPVTVKRTHVLRMAVRQGLLQARGAIEAGKAADDQLEPR